jgi:hypothetical protein
MKKFLLLVAIFASAFLVSVKAVTLPEVTDHKKVTIYMLRGHGCSHCYDGLVFLYGNLNKYSDYIEFKAYEVWYNEENSKLFSALLENFGLEKGGVPLFVIGDSYYTAGFGDNTGNELIETALNEYQNADYKDLVAKIIKKNKFEVTSETLEEAAEQEGINEEVVIEQEKTQESGKYDTLIIVGIFVVIIGGVAALMLTNRKEA